MNRRSFLSMCAATGVLPFARRTRVARLPIGFQTWVVREALNEDYPGTLARMAAMGYQDLEMCSPYGYGRFGFGPLSELPVSTLRSAISDAGLTCVSSHFTSMELREDVAARIDFAHEFGLTQMVLSHPGIGDDASMDDWKRVCEDINGWGAAVNESGLQFAYHNHNFEFGTVDDQLIYDVLLSQLDPEVVKMQFQVWVVIAGYKAADYFRAHPGRFLSAHLSDWTGTDSEMAPVGSGVVDWTDFFEAGQVGGLENVYVEMPPELLPDSATYLAAL